MSASPLLRRIAITGIGLVTPLGLTREETWEGLLAGRRAVQWIDDAPPENSLPIGRRHRLFGARVPLERSLTSRMACFARRAAREAVEQAGVSQAELRQAACVIGTSKIDLRHFDYWARQFSPAASHNEEDERAGFVPVGKVDDLASHPGPYEVLFPDSIASAVAADYQCEAAVLCPVAACATGLVSIIQAAHLIQDGHCPVALAGSADASLHSGLLASYRRLGVLAQPGEDPARCCRPFDESRTGFAVGEGAAILVLEDWQHARQRGASILAEWIDGIIASGCSDLIRIDRTGRDVAISLKRLLQRNALSPSQIDLVSVHGTATRLNDEVEAAAFADLFSTCHAPVPAFGIKGAMGHLMGAAGTVELAASLLALVHQTIPPTVNLETQSPAFQNMPLSFNAHTPPATELRSLLKLSLGFGGTIAAALIQSSAPGQAARPIWPLMRPRRKDFT